MDKVRVIVAGSRNISDYEYLREQLDNIFNSVTLFGGKEIIIVSGRAKGVDTMGERYADERGLCKELYPADWKNLNVEPCVVRTNKYGKYNAAAGNIRNEKMQEVSDVAVVFWDGKSRGSKDMISQMKKAEKPVVVIEDGDITIH